ncbi:MAG: very short patch repair endonuclease [Thiovulaceae bacterium]|nr:very short patch repair endonuclease [Sulfurimonadaceae bacterium]
MADVLTKSQRSYCMSRISGKDTKPELLLRKLLWSRGARYRLNYKVPGRPDLVFVGKRVAVFVDGCFWHRCSQHYVKPKTRAEFWEAKIQGNVERDKKNNALLKEAGWTVIRLWEHDVEQNVDSCISRIEKVLDKA